MLLHKSNYQQEKKHLDNKGFSLIELLISIAILAIMLAPLLNNFVTAAKVSVKAKKIQNETFLAQNILEEVKAQSIYDIANEYNFPGDFGILDNVSELKWKNGISIADGYEAVVEAQKSSIRTSTPDGLGGNTIQYELVVRKNVPYFFAKKNIVYGDKEYDALITIDSTKYIETDPTNELGDKIGYNTVKLPMISEINTSKNILAVQSYETELAIATLYGKHIAYCAEQIAFHSEDVPPFSITQYNVDDIENSLHKNMNINITKKMNETEVKVTFVYTCLPLISGCDSETYSVVNKKILSPMDSIYIFYNPSYSDSVTINKDPSVSDAIDIYLVKQDIVIGSVIPVPEKIEGTIPTGINLYSNTIFSNTDASVKSKELVQKDVAKNRIFDIKVQLYNAGMNFNADQLCVEFNSTKEE